MLGIAHAALSSQSYTIIAFYIALVGEMPLDHVIDHVSWTEAALWGVGEAALLLLTGLTCMGLAFWRFLHKDFVGV